ncbi:unnamed protein product [Closterium sp. NIES-53]
MRFLCTPLLRSTSARCFFPFLSSIFLFTSTTEDIRLLPIRGVAVLLLSRLHLPQSLISPSAAPHAHAPAGPAPVDPVAPVAPVQSPEGVVVVDAHLGALVLDVPFVSVALPAPVVAVGSSPHAVSATTGGRGEVGGGGGRCVGSRPTDCGGIGVVPGRPGIS